MIRPTWQPASLEGWCAPGGPLHDVPTLDDLVATADASDEVLLVDGDRRWRGTDLAGVVADVTGWLAGRGVGRGDVVAWQLPNRWEAVVLYRACWRLGAVAAPLHHLAGSTEVASLVATLAPTVLVLASAPTVEPRRDAGAGLSAAETVVVLDEGSTLESLRGRPTAPAAPPLPSDVAVVLHTSGSSGRPKGVLHTHRGLAYKARLMVGVHGLGPGDRVLMPAPLAHVSGLLNGVLVPGAGGFRSVLMGRWDAAAALRLIREEQVTFMVGPPTFFVALEAAEGFSTDAVASLRLVSAGGAGVTPAFVERTSSVFGATVKRSYGSTEAPTVTTSVGTDDLATMATTDGRPVGAARVRIVDPGTGAEAATGTPGEIQVSGPELFAGYTDPARTAEATADDWYRTGDLGTLDDDGRLVVSGRLTDTIIRGGENISAAEVEAHLEAHPAVRHAVAVAEPDERLGERVCAFVELSESGAFDLPACRAWFTDRGVARYRTPERVVAVAALPLLASGKPDRAALSRRAAELARRSGD